jgi:hypothetical protein
MDGNSVSDIAKDQPDATGAVIDTVYSKIADIFAVYRTPERVMIQYADDPALGLEQRRALSPLNPIRGEINGLIDGWRTSHKPKNQCRARMFDRRTADALTVALQGDQVNAEELLKGVKADVLEERVSMGRTEYVLFATLCALAVFLLFGAFTLAAEQSLNTLRMGEFIVANQLWLAVGMGCLGALFSIATGIRGRTIRTDLQRRDNIVDAILRIMIGAVSAIVLFSLLRSGLVEIAGLGEFESATTAFAVDVAIIVAFLAGFSERLVGDYLARATLASGADAAAAAASPALQSAARPEVEATERNPRGKLEVDIANRAAAAAVPEVHVHADDDEDGCLCDVKLDVDETTDDTELPVATGGVERQAA